MNTAFRRLMRRARRFQFGLRGMFLALTVFSVWLGLYVHRARQRTDAVRSIRSQGGRVVYDFQRDGGFDSQPPLPRRLLNSLGVDFFCDVVDVQFDRDCDDATFAKLTKLTRLESLSMLDASRVTDAGVVRLATLTELIAVVLMDAHITDESLRALGKRHRLIALNVPGARVSDAGLAYLRGNPDLLFLHIGGKAVGVTDAGMTSIGGLLKLEELDLDAASITSKGLERLRGLVKLRFLCLSNNTRIGDDGLGVVAHLSALEDLELRNTGLTSIGLEHLKGLTKLRVLDLSDNRGVTDEGIACLSRLVNLEELKLHHTAITSKGLRHLKGLTKLRVLDISENASINEDALPRLASLAALKRLEVHHTNVTGRGPLTAEHLRQFGSLKRLRWLDLSGTGADTRRLGQAMPRCQVIGSRQSDLTRPGAENVPYYFDVVHEARAIENGYFERTVHTEYNERPLPEFCHELLETTSRRMVALCKLDALAGIFERLRPTTEAYARRVSGLSRADEQGRDQALWDFLAAARSDALLRRLYLASTDLEMADLLGANVEYLEELKERWALTDVETEEYEEAPGYLRACLRDAGAQLGLQTDSSSDVPSSEIIAIWQQTRTPREPDQWRSLSCWEQPLGRPPLLRSAGLRPPLFEPGML